MNEREKERVEALLRLAAQKIVKLKEDHVELTRQGKQAILSSITEDMLFWADILRLLESTQQPTRRNLEKARLSS